MERKESPEKRNRAAGWRRPLESRRPPVAAILILVAFVFLILVFVTSRQMAGAKAHRLRLLAGFGERVSITIPDIAERFASIIQEHEDPERIATYIEAVPRLALVAVSSEEGAQGGIEGARLTEEEIERFHAIGPSLTLSGEGGIVELVYVGRPGQEPPKAADEEPERPPEEPAAVTSVGTTPGTASPDATAGENESGAAADPPSSSPPPPPPPPAPVTKFVGRIDVVPVLDRILIPEIFDSVLIASGSDGQVFHQSGEPELAVADLEPLLARATPPLQLADTGATVLTETKIANAGGWFREGAYRLFLQPISLRPPDLAGRIHVESEPWVACGLISEQNLLASSFTTSPLLLFILVISFPSALIAWPFLKLVFISPRQRMTRFDVGALLFSSLLALSLGTLLIFDLLYVARVDGEVDRQLRTLAKTVEDNLRQELLAMHLQLNRVDDAVELVGRRDASEAALDGAAPTTTIHLPPAASSRPLREEGELMQRLVERHADKLSDYPFFHSVFWADREGDQIGKLALREPAILTNNVRDRDYYKCARGTGATGRYALRFEEEEDLRRFLLERGRLAGRRPTLAALGYPEGREPRDGHVEFCLEPIVSKTTGQDLVVLSLGTGDSDRPVMALTTQLLSLAHPLLPNGYGLAVVDGTGRAVFHSDRRRNQTENFLKASDQDRLLRSLLDHQRQGAVTSNYWGRRHRLHLRPLEGLPWTVVAYRSKGDLRVRNFELVYDFMNAFLPYAALVFLASFFGIRWRWLRRRLLWPDSANRGVYRLAALVAVAATGVFALVLVLGGIRTVFFASYLLPASFVGLLLLASRYRDGLRELMEVQAAPGRPRRWRLGRAAEETPAEVVPGLLVGRPSRLAVWCESIAFGLGIGGALFAFARSRGFVTLFLLLLVVVALGFWLFRRSYFVGKQRRLAYTFALTSFLFVTAVLPAVGFFRLAAQRQLQFLVQETQEELARSLESHEGALRSARGPWAPTGGFDRVIDGMRQAHLKSFFATELAPDDAEADGATARQDRLWPAGRAATGEPLHLRMITSRLVPLNELSSEIHGVDLSRFEAVRPEWKLAGEPARLFGTFRRSWGTGGSIRLVSRRFSDFTGDIQPFRALLLGGLLLIVVGSPGVMGRFLANRVLLARLVRSRRTPTVNDLFGTLRPQQDEESSSWLFNRARVLLVTSIPELAVQEANDERFELVELPDWEAERRAEEQGQEQGQGQEEDQQQQDQQEQNGQKTGDAAGLGNDDAVVEKRARLIAGFVPSLDDRDLLRRQVSWLRAVLDERRRAVVLVSASSFSTILRLRREATSQSGFDEMEPELRDLVSLLASFVAQFAADSQEGNGQTSGLERLVRYRRQQFDPWYRPPQEAKPATDDEPAQEARPDQRSDDPLLRRRHRLLDVVLEECSLNKQLQRAGLQAIREVLEDDACTETQLVSQIGYLAAPYYEALWASCGVDEKVVLVQLAHEGLVNPKNLDTVLDLLQKGLVVRDPELRPMNRSFARFVTRAVRPAEVAAWEEEIGTSSWSVLKWLLPLPLLLLGGFLFLTQQDAFSNVIGLAIAIGSVVPTLVNLFDQFQRLSARRVRAAEAGITD